MLRRERNILKVIKYVVQIRFTISYSIWVLKSTYFFITKFIFYWKYLRLNIYYWRVTEEKLYILIP